MSSPVIVDEIIFVSSNKKAYYAIDTTTGEIQWTYKNDNAGEFIISSSIYNNGIIYLIDQFFIVAVDAFDGEIIWRKFAGAELYVSQTYADGKLYVTTDQRSIYVLNATNGEKITWISTGSNSWSSPTIYEGRLYVGNNDWNIYCFSEYPALNSSINIELDVKKIFLGESISGSGYLVPRLTKTPILLLLTQPDGDIVKIQVETDEQGSFNFTYQPKLEGNWTMAAQWQSDKGYYFSVYSHNMLLEVVVLESTTSTNCNNLFFEYTLVTFFVILIIIVVVIRTYRNNRLQTILNA
jgi:hypothetical protein